MKKCPYCAEEIQDGAIKCRFCGEFLEKKPQVKWYYKPSMLIIIFLCVGPFVIPLVWLSPHLDRKKKIIATLVVLILTYLMTVFLVNALKTISGYYQQLFQL